MVTGCEGYLTGEIVTGTHLRLARFQPPGAAAIRTERPGRPSGALDNETELLNTRTKLRELQDRHEALRVDLFEDPRVRRLTMMSLKRLINQLTEEITRFESRLHRV